MIKLPKKIVLIFVLLLIITGGIFIVSGLFVEQQNSPKMFFILVTLTLLLIGCFLSCDGLRKLKDSLQSCYFLNGVMIVCLLTTIHGFLQYFGIISSNHSAFPITGTFENPAGFAAVQAAMYPFVISRCFDRENSRLMRLFSVAVSIICFISVILSGSRTGILALCSVIVVVMANTDSVASFFRSHKWLWLPIIVITITSFILLYYVKQDSADGRIFIWNRCFEMIKEHPLLGYGASGFHRCYMSAQADYFQTHQDSPYVMLADNVTHPFNEYIKLTIQFGLVGLFAAMVLLIWIVRRLFKSENKTKILGLSFVASLFIMCQFSYPFRYAVVWLLGGIAIIPAFFKPNEKSIKFPRYIRLFASSLLLVFLALTLKRTYYDMKWAEISKRSIVGQTERMLKYYESMKHTMRHNPLFLYNYAAELNYSGHNKESIALASECTEMWNDYDVQILFATNYSSLHDKEKAIQSFDVAYNMIPCRFEPLYGKMLVYKDFCDTLNVIRMANEIIEKPVKIQSDRVAIITNRAQQILIELE